jgi:imidazole glycerol-phosphate synthase subunit HisF
LPSGYEVMIDGARVATGLDALNWARRGEELGAGEVVVNSIDQDGTHQGYDLRITRMIADAVNLPVVASGGAGATDHVAAAFEDGHASAAIISSLIYSPRMERTMSVNEVKTELAKAHDLSIRPTV